MAVIGENRNSFVPTLLSWHAHDTGGVRVPFRGGGDPLSRTIATALVEKLREAARAVAAGSRAPRWFFLVGGPGNGKSQMVEFFIQELDGRLSCDGRLVQEVSKQFATTPLPRRVDVPATADLGSAFGSAVGRLVIVQDASASDQASHDAAQALADDLSSLLADRRTSPGLAPPVFLVCANRGLLARAMHSSADKDKEVLALLQTIVRATGLGEEALVEHRLACWPLAFPDSRPYLAGLIGCWPLDMESLLVRYQEGGSPLDEIITEATQTTRWEESDCNGCSSQDLCPFLTNARWLRDNNQRKSVLAILRRAELATGERWNFRASFSLTAEFIVGEWQDLSVPSMPEHPCDWVHSNRKESAGGTAAAAAAAGLLLVRRLYPQALYGSRLPEPDSTILEFAIDKGLSITARICEEIQQLEPSQSTAIRRRLCDQLAKLDPAVWSPSDDGHVLAQLEDSYSQTVIQGNQAWSPVAQPSQIELGFLRSLTLAEAECEVEFALVESARAAAAARYIRQLGSSISKRSVGSRLGNHAQENMLIPYEASLRDVAKLAELQTWLRQLLGQPVFRFSALESFGQAHSEGRVTVTLEGSTIPIRPVPAPQPATDLPAHDLPAIRIAKYPIPLTFDLFSALLLRRAGCETGSLPATVRASIDRIRQLHAGSVCRDKEQFVESGTKFVIRNRGNVVLESEAGIPRFRP